MTWTEDGWPVIGWDPDGNGRGEPVTRWRKPALPPQQVAVPLSSDEFDGESLGLQWQWQANPDSAWWSLTEVPGVLRLFAQPLPDGAGNLWPVPSLLLQKPPAEAFQVTTQMTFDPQRPGERAGLLVFGSDYAWVGVEQTPEGRAVVVKRCLGAREGGSEEVAASVPAPDGPVQLRVEWRPDGLCRFGVSADGREFMSYEPSFVARPRRWAGAKSGCLPRRTRGKLQGRRRTSSVPRRVFLSVVAKTSAPPVDAWRDPPFNPSDSKLLQPDLAESLLRSYTSSSEKVGKGGTMRSSTRFVAHAVTRVPLCPALRRARRGPFKGGSVSGL
jgi:Beta xylosidase C-terminal Concanavalin A-like domain